MKRYAYLGLFILIFGHIKAQKHYIPRAQNLEMKSYGFEAQIESHTSDTRIDSDGVESAFLNGEGFSQNQLQIQGRYGWTKEIQVSGGLRYRINSSQVLNAGSNSITDLSNSGLESAFFRAQYMMSRKRAKKNLLSFYADIRQPLYSLPAFDSNAPLSILNLGDAQREIELGIDFFFKTNSSFKGFDLGLAFKNYEELANQVKFRVLGVAELSRLAISAGIEGALNIGDGPQITPHFTGSTFLYNSLNQEIINIKASFMYRLSKQWRLLLGYEKDLSGNSTDLGSRFLLGLDYRVDTRFREKFQREKFKNYNLEAVVEKVSSQGNYVIINKGFVHGVQKNMVFDFFDYDYKGGNKLLARGVVARTRSKQSAVKIVEWFARKRAITDNTLARGDINR